MIGDQVRIDLPRIALIPVVEGLQIIPHIQNNPGGVADAISVAIDSINGPFLVLLGDMVLLHDHLGPRYSGPEYASIASRELVHTFEKYGLPCVGVFPVDLEKISNYGVVRITDGKIDEIVEKPTLEEAPGNYVLCGRYVFPKNTKRIMEKYPATKFGELQSIEILNHIIQDPGLRAVKLDHMEMYDSGDPVAWLKSQNRSCFEKRGCR